jgi:hypothetical protein
VNTVQTGGSLPQADQSSASNSRDGAFNQAESLSLPEDVDFKRLPEGFAVASFGRT